MMCMLTNFKVTTLNKKNMGRKMFKFANQDNEKYSTKLDVFSSSDLPLKVNSIKSQLIFKQNRQDILSIENEVEALMMDIQQNASLINIKSRGALTKPNKNIAEICKIAELLSDHFNIK
ncbi:uncharacterized protein LOC126554883 [Aphis gossypii]|uniref:uncharacterized protein LOC126554883 n=1 Tax=Aphis gossypii TaxID=80765 RepID=UPI002158F2A7|nr:uncharacterized protein LOC126554883 [Aphis gossypii]